MLINMLACHDATSVVGHTSATPINFLAHNTRQCTCPPLFLQLLSNLTQSSKATPNYGFTWDSLSSVCPNFLFSAGALHQKWMISN